MTDRARVMEVLRPFAEVGEFLKGIEYCGEHYEEVMPVKEWLAAASLLADLQAEAEAAKTAWCRMCEGKGTLTLNQTTSDGEKFQNHVPCVDCNGTGVVLEAEAGGEAERGVEWTIPKFVAEVERRAEEKMLLTGKLEGAHYAAMKQLFSELAEPSAPEGE